MKKLKALVGTLFLSIMLVGNVFATGPSGSGVWAFFADSFDSVMYFFREGESCPLRQCTNCRPTERDENGNCRPRD